MLMKYGSILPLHSFNYVVCHVGTTVCPIISRRYLVVIVAAVMNDHSLQASGSFKKSAAQWHGGSAAERRVHYQSVRYIKLCHAVGVVAVGKLDKVYQILRVHLCLRNVLTIV
jgi:hypothetical protein